MQERLERLYKGMSRLADACLGLFHAVKILGVASFSGPCAGMPARRLLLLRGIGDCNVLVLGTPG